MAENFQLQVTDCKSDRVRGYTAIRAGGLDLNREFWKSSAEAEVQALEHELRTQRFSGIIQLHADDTSEGIYGFVRGHTLTENLLRPALCEAGKVLRETLMPPSTGSPPRWHSFTTITKGSWPRPRG